MPTLTFSRSIAAGATDQPLVGTVLEFPTGGRIMQVSILQRTTASGVTQAIWAGSEAVTEASPIQAGGTAGVTPSELNTPGMQFLLAAGTRLRVLNVNTTAGALTVDTIVKAEPVA